MSREVHDALRRPWALIAPAAWLALALVTPLLFGSAIESGGSALALVSLAVVLLLGSRRFAVLLVHPVGVRPGRSSSAVVHLNGDVTDPPHNPVLPRAPGLA